MGLFASRGMTQHSQLGASTASRWMACPGSVKLCAEIPSTWSYYAQEGTAAHALMELSLSEQMSPASVLGETLEGFEVTEEMVLHVATAVDYCLSIPNLTAGLYWIERHVTLEALSPPAPMYGTTDFMAYDEPNATLYVVDLKYGKGAVQVENNPQLRYYAVGGVLALTDQKPQKAVTTIIQPRGSHRKGPVRSEVLEIGELRAFARTLIGAARQTELPDPPLITGKQCRYCPAREVCPARNS